MWNLAGIEPELIDYRTMKILSPGYQLRPEIIESAYYLYYFTHDPQYRAMGYTFFNAIVKNCRTPSAFAAISDVRTMKQRDDMESFFFAETLKYLYLLLANPTRIDLSRTVFNTEAHPLEIAPTVHREAVSGGAGSSGRHAVAEAVGQPLPRPEHDVDIAPPAPERAVNPQE